MKTIKKAVGAAGINAGKATKYKKVKFDVAKIIALYKSGKPVSQIAQGHWISTQHRPKPRAQHPD
ncbi:MAG TPA: hypothetical protein VGK24_00050 [Candidatus Angelobacter sp.]|jgi:hypothetical protein